MTPFLPHHGTYRPCTRRYERVSKAVFSGPPVVRYARPRFPSAGSLEPRFPTFSVAAWTGTAPRYYAQLRLPAAPLGSLRSSLAPRYLACFLRLCPVVGSLAAGSALPAPGLLVSRYPCSSGVSDKETVGSLQFPSSPYECMPRSQPPVVSQTLGLASLGLLPSGRATPSAFPLGFSKRLSSANHNSTYFEAPSRGLHPRYPRLRTSLRRNARGFAADLVPPFSQVGLVLIPRDSPTGEQ
jgi:hypothetical protein